MTGAMAVVGWCLLLVAVGLPAAWRLGAVAGLSRPLRVLVAWMVGALALFFSGLGFALVGVGWTEGVLFAGTAVLALAGGWVARRSFPSPAATEPALPRPRRRRWLDAAILLVLVAAWGSVALRQVREPVWSNDAFTIWVLKARALARTGTVPSSYFTDQAWEFSHPQYPLLWPMVMAAPFVGAGDVDEWGVTAFAPFLTLLLVAGLCGELARKRLPIPWVGGLGILILSIRALFGAFAVGLAELPLTLAMLVVVAAGAELNDEAPRSRAAAVIVALGLVAAVLTKDEGGVLVVAVGLAALSMRPKVVASTVGVTLLPAVLVLLISTAIRRELGLPLQGYFDSRLMSFFELATRLGAIGAFAWRAVVAPLLPVGLPLVAVAVLGLRGGGRVGLPGRVAGLLLLGYLPAWLFTRIELAWYLENSLERVLAPFAVPLILETGFLLAKVPGVVAALEARPADVQSSQRPSQE